MAEGRSGGGARDALSAEWDDQADGWHFQGEPAGPAGLASVELPDGVEVDVDVAEPTEIVEVWVPDVDDAARARAMVAAATSDPDAIGRLALAEDVLDGAFHPSEAALTLAAVDRALASGMLAGLFARSEVDDRVRAAIDAVHAGSEDLFEVQRPELIADALRELQQKTGPDAALDAVVEALRDAGRSPRVAAGAEPRLAAAAAFSVDDLAGAPRAVPVSPLLDIVDLDSLPAGLGPRQVAVRATTASEIEVRVGAPLPARPWWMRVYHRDMIVAAAPLLADGDAGGVARLLVPPAHLRSVEVDIANRPEEPRPSRDVRQFERAVRTGRVAARAERAQRFAEAASEWQQCARFWKEATDSERLTAALDRSRVARQFGAVQPLPGGPLLSDLVVEPR